MAHPSERTRKICVVTHDFPTERQPYRGAPIWRTLEGLNRYADLSILCPVPGFPGAETLLGSRNGIYNQYPAAGELPGVGIRYFAVPVLTHPRSGEQLSRRLLRAIAQDKPDVILSYWIYPEAYASVLAGQFLGIPVVAGSRGSDLKVREKSRTVRDKIAFAVRRADGLLTVSEDLSRTAVGLGALAPRVRTIINGVDTEVFRPSPVTAARNRLGLDADTRAVFFVGRLVTMKGVTQLLDAVARLNRRGPNSWKLVMAGEGPLRADLARQAETLAMSSNLILLGALRPAEVALWMNAADVFCLPSESEGCPNVVQEALSCGCPVVATAVGGLPELIDENCGILLPDNRPATLSTGLEKAVRTIWDRPAIAGAHRRDWDQVARETLAACERVIQESQTAGREEKAAAGSRFL